MLKVLVVDDEESIRHMLTLVLKKAGYKVKAVADGELALKELLSQNYDMALCDIRMPKMDGHALLREIRERKLQVTIIMMSAYGDVETALQAIKAGAYDYIPKPFKKDEVLLTLHKAEEREHLKRENLRLKAAQREQFSFGDIVGSSPKMQHVFDTVRKVAAYKTTVLIGGESGTGKELLARAIHMNSDRKNYPMIPINCGAIPENLLESELFGHVKGAFTDATSNKPGLFQQADKGTLFLDEIAELPLSLQVKLLRVLQEGEVRRVGDTRATSVDVRIIAASATDIGVLAETGTFRKDLFYRLNVMSMVLPALRERKEDIPLLVQHFVERCNAKLGRQIKDVHPEAMKLIMNYAWPGNIRELSNAIEVSIILSEGDTILADALPPTIISASDELHSLWEGDDLSIKRLTRKLEQILIRRALEKTHGNRTRASELLELSHRALLYKIKEYGLQDVQ